MFLGLLQRRKRWGHGGGAPPPQRFFVTFWRLRRQKVTKNDHLIRSLARDARARGIHTARFQFFPTRLVDMRDDPIHAQIKAGWGRGCGSGQRGGGFQRRHDRLIVRPEHRAAIFGCGPGAIGTDLNKTQTFQHFSCLRKRILGRP